MKLQVNGTELFFDVVGSGLDADFRPRPAMIILHGGPGFDHTYLRPWLDPVSEVAQLIYIDQRGCGRSQRHTHEYYQLGIMADDIVLFCKTLDIERPIVLGQSFGGFVALIIAARPGGRGVKENDAWCKPGGALGNAQCYETAERLTKHDRPLDIKGFAKQDDVIGHNT